MLLTPADNIITGKSTYLFGYIKSAKLDLKSAKFSQLSSQTRAHVSPFHLMFDGLFWLSDSRSVADRRDTSGRASFIFYFFFFFSNLLHSHKTRRKDDRATSFRLLLWQCGNHAKRHKKGRKKEQRGIYIFCWRGCMEKPLFECKRWHWEGGERVKRGGHACGGFTIVTDWCGGMTLIFSPSAQ